MSLNNIQHQSIFFHSLSSASWFYILISNDSALRGLVSLTWFCPKSLLTVSNFNSEVIWQYITRCRLTNTGITMLNIRRSCDRLIFNMGISIPGKDGLYTEAGPCTPFFRPGVFYGSPAVRRRGGAVGCGGCWGRPECRAELDEAKEHSSGTRR